MKEIKDIVHAFENAVRNGKKTALATVVNIEGSSYRRPGARMLVTEDGQLTGAISGGCLEGDALRKAVLAITQKRNKLVIYDTTDEDDAKLGIQLGCNGIVSILFEPIDEAYQSNPIHVLRIAIEKRAPAILITGYSLNQEEHLGTCDQEHLPVAVINDLNILAKEVHQKRRSEYIHLNINQNQQHFFVEYYQPPISLIIVGAGNDAFPLAIIANQIGWNITVVDGRSSHATSKRFPAADAVFLGKPKEVVEKLILDDRTAIVLMTHNYNYDIEMLSMLVKMPVAYIGLLGPASKRERMFLELAAKGIIFSDINASHIYGPTGLDLGAETAEEIALSILSEIMAVIQQKDPIHLRQKQYAIHHSPI